MSRTGFRIVPKMTSNNVCAFYIVLANGDNRQIAEVHFPNDGQMVDNVESAQLICDVLKKRIRKSV